jgi:hypothetical protein
MFCLNCGAELRPGADFCTVCGAATPKPMLRMEKADRSRQLQRRDAQTRTSAAQDSERASGAAPFLSSPDTDRRAAPAAPVSYQVIRQASGQRGGMRPLPPAASLAVSRAPSAPAPDGAASRASSVPGVESGHAANTLAAPDSAPGALVLPSTPGDQPPAGAQAPGVMVAVDQALVSAAPAVQEAVQQSLNGYHPAGRGASGGMPGGAQDLQPVDDNAASGIHLPGDVPNRVALGALACMFLSFFLPWLIISGTRATPLTIGWPVILPLAAILATGLTVLMPERALYMRFFLALPLALGCFALGSALLLFLVSSAIAANTVGSSFLGVDIGFLLFALAALALTCAGYYKLVRELPLLLAGRMRLAPLPGALRGLAGAPIPSMPAAPQRPPSDAGEQAASS